MHLYLSKETDQKMLFYVLNSSLMGYVRPQSRHSTKQNIILLSIDINLSQWIHNDSPTKAALLK
jgi:hypothetical protein